jgi:branched-chain amino acid transport system permease protein
VASIGNSTGDAPRVQAGPVRSVSAKDALRDAGVTAFIAFGLFLPLVGFQTITNIRNELVLTARWNLLAGLVVFVGVARFLFSIAVAPYLTQRAARPVAAPSATRNWLRRWAIPFAIAFVVLYPLIVVITAGFSGGVKWIDNFGIQILIYVMLGWGLNIVVGLAGLLDLGYVAFYAVGAYSYALLASNFGIQILIYVMLGWGLNIVVGLAGLLDLGYVAFYAVGAYSYALLASNFGFSFWILLPLAGILASFWGILLGFPVLRLRGDYLAIVTLAFGEIIRIVIVNWVDLTNGYAGISGIPRPTLFGIPFTADDDGFAATFGLPFTPLYRVIFLYYVILALAMVTCFVTVRLRRLPVGRAWEALREDEVACRSLGINTTNTKLTAFAMGAMFAGFAGSFFAARQGFISPESFTFLESATILSIVVLGGMGSQIGVAIAAVVMIGGTEIMRDLDFLKRIFGATFDPTQYRMLLFGLAMVVIMIWRPRGLIATRSPSVFLKERKTISADLVKEGRG